VGTKGDGVVILKKLYKSGNIALISISFPLNYPKPKVILPPPGFPQKKRGKQPNPAPGKINAAWGYSADGLL